ncbi:hypothetical protein BpHYR1_018049 [Brachionus plicatilis]|uniref:Uncharacterized protein n=1 Tax=Brachionus plicatilis TaxID=10195 RepID=A0A3M7R0M7_BRAPC|nr:hypothetical protein BpHYR1_018049 [Brachionus plicatilis]
MKIYFNLLELKESVGIFNYSFIPGTVNKISLQNTLQFYAFCTPLKRIIRDKEATRFTREMAESLLTNDPKGRPSKE